MIASVRSQSQVPDRPLLHTLLTAGLNPLYLHSC